jgi:putative oxidoreductase
MAWVATVTELVGGAAILVGAFVVATSLPLIARMLVAMIEVHMPYGFSSVNTIGLSPDGPQFGPPGYEVNLLYVAGLLVLMMAGAGVWSVDDWRARMKRASVA